MKMMATITHCLRLCLLFLLFIAGTLLFPCCEDATFYIEGGDEDAAADTVEDGPGDVMEDPAADSLPDVRADGEDGDDADDTPETSDAPTGPCAGVTCSGHGACIVVEGEPACDCEPGYDPAGLDCVPDPCASVACGANAHCDGGDCLCDEGYEGDPYAGCTSLPTEEERVRRRLVEIASAELGYCEGVDVRPYMLDQPGFWCYDFVAWVYEQADFPIPRPNSLPMYYTGSLPDGWRPEPGDLIKFTIQHYGMVAELSADGMRITTIEGNYSSCVRSRTITDSDVEYYGTLDDLF